MTWVAVDLLRLKKRICRISFSLCWRDNIYWDFSKGTAQDRWPCMTVISPQLEAVMRLSSRI